MKLLFLDTETTGNDVAKDRLSQVCYKTADELVTEYFKPPLPISVKSMSITHITNKMVEDKPVFKEDPLFQTLQKLLDDHVLVAHNAKFDKAILEAEGLSVPTHICTLRLARALDEAGIIPEYNLQFLRYYLDLDIEGTAHDAEGDVLVLEALFNRLYEKMQKEMPEAKILPKMIEISNTPSLIKKFSFGKHKDKTLEEVAREDRGYLEWLLSQKKQSEDDDEDWLYTLEHYLK